MNTAVLHKEYAVRPAPNPCPYEGRQRKLGEALAMPEPYLKHAARLLVILRRNTFTLWWDSSPLDVVSPDAAAVYADRHHAIACASSHG